MTSATETVDVPKSLDVDPVFAAPADQMTVVASDPDVAKMAEKVPEKMPEKMPVLGPTTAAA